MNSQLCLHVLNVKTTSMNMVECLYIQIGEICVYIVSE
jgi:hypothetical protein